MPVGQIGNLSHHESQIVGSYDKIMLFGVNVKADGISGKTESGYR